MVGEIIGISILLSEQHFCRFRVNIVGNLGIEGLISALSIIFAGHHLVTHILRDGKHLCGGQTHIQVIAVDAVLHILEGIGGGNLYFLVVRQHRGAGGNVFLSFIAENGHQHFHHGFLLSFILFYLPGHSQLAHWISQQPIILFCLPEIWQDNTVDTVFSGNVVCQSRRVADHSGLSAAEGLGDRSELQFLIAGLDPDVFQELLVFFKYFGPDGVIQSHLAVLCFAFVRHTPLGPLQAHQFRDGTALHGLQTGIIIKPVGLEALNALSLKGVDGSHELGIVGGQRNVILVKQIFVGHDAVHLGTHWQPANGTTGFPIDLKITAVEGPCNLRGTQIHQIIRKRCRIVQREPAAGNDVRYGLSTGKQILVIVHGIIALNKSKLNVRKLLLQPGAQFF